MTEQRYLILIEAGETGCSAYAPDLPGCVATAATREDVEREMRNAIAFHLQGLQEAGQPIPEPSERTAAYVKVTA
jgi:predicted RNase H-like HicB family nuclease